MSIPVNHEQLDNLADGRRAKGCGHPEWKAKLVMSGPWAGMWTWSNPVGSLGEWRAQGTDKKAYQQIFSRGYWGHGGTQEKREAETGYIKHIKRNRNSLQFHIKTKEQYDVPTLVKSNGWSGQYRTQCYTTAWLSSCNRSVRVRGQLISFSLGRKVMKRTWFIKNRTSAVLFYSRKLLLEILSLLTCQKGWGEERLNPYRRAAGRGGGAGDEGVVFENKRRVTRVSEALSHVPRAAT